MAFWNKKSKKSKGANSQFDFINDPNRCCLRCGQNQFVKDKIRVSTSFWTAWRNWQDKIYTTIACENCGLTEFYDTDETGWV